MPGILIVDDEEGVRRSLKKVLESGGYSVYLAEGGEKAIAIVRERREDIEIVISDFKMPGLDGLKTLEAIGKINPEITRIILTGYATIDNAIEAVNSGIDGFVLKPFGNLELKEKIREYNLRKRLKLFVSEKVLEEMIRAGGNVAPRSRTVSIVFVDIRGFSSLCEKMSHEDVSRMLSCSYFSPLDNIIHEYNGTLDKHIGDGIMGIFGAPVSYGDDAERAVLSAIKMRDEMIRSGRDAAGDGAGFSVGIGVSTGEAIAGVFGSNRKKEYTVYGFTVNLAARLERLAGTNEILICRKTYQKVHDIIRAVKMEPVNVRGIDRKVDVYRVADRI